MGRLGALPVAVAVLATVLVPLPAALASATPEDLPAPASAATVTTGREAAAPATAATAEVAGIISRLPTRERVVALTFDGCQAGESTVLDQGIVDVLLERGVPFTIFAGGRFARDHAFELRPLAALPTVDIQNHSFSHPRDLRLLDDARVESEIRRADAEIRALTGRHTTLFRFPGGLADERTVAIAARLGLAVVHWRWAEGDPSPAVSADRLVEQTLARTRAGDILIFHINGRGVHTAAALPRILDGLTARGFRFVLARDYLPRGR